MTENPGGEGAMPLLRVLGFALLLTVAIALIAPPDLGRTGEPQRLHVSADGRARFRAFLHEQTEARTSR